MAKMEEMWHKYYFDVLKERDAKQMFDKQCRKRNIVDRTPQVGDVVLLSNEKGKLENLSRIIELSKNNGEAIISAKVVLNKTKKWWQLSKI